MGENLTKYAARLFSEAAGEIPGIRRGEDPECLHRYRVKIRALMTFLDAFGSKATRRDTLLGREALKSLIKPTNPLRDLDVLIDKLSLYRQELSPQLAAQLGELEKSLRKKRGKALERVRVYLDSASFGEILTGVGELLKTLLPTLEGQAADSRGTGRAFKSQLRRLRTAAKRLHPSSRAKRFHRVRLLVKTVRYTLDFAVSGRDEGPEEELRQEVKRLQDALGAVQDLEVQRSHLRRLDPENQARHHVLKLIKRHAKKHRHDVLKKLKLFLNPQGERRLKDLHKRLGSERD